MSSTTIVVLVAVALLGLSSSSAAGLALANMNQATAAPTLAPGASPPETDAGATTADAGTAAPSVGSQSNPFAPTGTAPAGAGTAKPSGTAKPPRVLPENGTYAPKRVQFQKPRTAKPRKPSPKTTAPAAPARASTTRAQCRDAIYNWVSGEVYPSVDFNVGYSTDTKWYDAYGSAGVRAACGGCVKKDEYGLTIGKAVGVKKYPDVWNDTKRSKLREDSTRQWLADYMVSDMPGTC